VPAYTGLPKQAVSWAYEDLVRTWRDVENFGQWVKGDLALLIMTKYGDQTLKKFATDVDVTLATLESYRTVAAAWPQKSRRLDIPWSVHQVLASQPDREELLANPAWPGKPWTVAAARLLVQERKAQANALLAGVEPVETGTDETGTGTATSFGQLYEGAGTGGDHPEEPDTSGMNESYAVEVRKALSKAARGRSQPGASAASPPRRSGASGWPPRQAARTVARVRQARATAAWPRVQPPGERWCAPETVRS
jgi:hypothetical protein